MKRDFSKLRRLSAELCLIRTGMKPEKEDIYKQLEFWIKLFDYKSIQNLKAEEIENLESFLLKRIISERIRTGLPFGARWYETCLPNFLKTTQ